MIEQAREVLRRKPLTGVVISIAVHAVLLLALVGVHPARTAVQKRGDALIVDLSALDESGGRGTPGPQAGAPLTPEPPAPTPAPKAPPTPEAPPARPTPPAPIRPPAAARTAPAPKVEPRQTSRAVAAAPQPPPAAEHGDMPAAKSAPQAPSDAATPPAARPEPETPPAVASAPPGPPGQVAMVPPPPDIRSAFRRGGGGGGTGAGGAGGTGTGRGGIVGEAIPLDTKEGDLQDYFERIRKLIKQNWVYPCLKNRDTHVCEFKSTALVVEFGILKPGPLQYVEVRQASQWGIYDDYAKNAIKLAAPFPPVPPEVMARFGRGSAGAAIVVRFVYVNETGITNVLR